ncbi:hypothetical protein [Xylanimonas ulmi]|uniref:Uncharacterized protein n=1 Tax=Xylanimonas ulmi TaxID=228973 RepID=A0A4V2EYF1_9MICO|nr:hypothetical protein [Xylanibacterium ulmi]RZS62770.1 hypothetical protein EV386_3118 [Xylanibacterium ulmi]
MSETATLNRSIANPRRTTLAGRTHAEVTAAQQPARGEEDAER